MLPSSLPCCHFSFPVSLIFLTSITTLGLDVVADDSCSSSRSILRLLTFAPSPFEPSHVETIADPIPSKPHPFHSGPSPSDDTIIQIFDLDDVCGINAMDDDSIPKLSLALRFRLTDFNGTTLDSTLVCLLWMIVSFTSSIWTTIMDSLPSRIIRFRTTLLHSALVSMI
jgi:hypothetical protein